MALLFDWSVWARQNQLPPDGDWLVWLLMAGRGMGKTRAGAEFIRSEVEHKKAQRIALVGKTPADVRDVMIEGESGLLSISPPWFKPQYEPSKRKLTWPNGAIALTFSSYEPDQLRGPQFDLAWCLVGETLVTMADYSLMPLSDVCVGDRVMTRDGARRVIASEMTQRNASLWKLTANDGRILIGTGNHEVFADGCFIPLTQVTPGAVLWSWQEQYCLIAKSSITMGKTTFGMKEVNSYKGLCGKPSSGLFPKVTSFITPMEINLTTDMRTLSLFPEVNMPVNMTWVDMWPKLQRNAQSGQSVNGKISSHRNVSATTVEIHTSQLAPIVHGAVRNVGSPPVIMVSCLEKLNHKADVYNISVEDTPEFFANGILVHNCDELRTWAYARQTWDNLMLGLRLGQHPRVVVTTTPSPIEVIRNLVSQPTTVVTKGTTYENRAFLASSFFVQIVSRYQGTTLGRQEIYAELLEDVPGALWKRADIKYKKPPDLQRIVVAIDPATTSGAGSDETGIIVAGKGIDGFYYVLADRSARISPDGWAKRAVQAYHDFKADRIIGEANNGGEMIELTLRTIDRSIPYKAVHASRGKQARAEPISALYEQGKIFHVEPLVDLEDQLCVWTPESGESPDRLDALVWALSELTQSGNGYAFEV